MQRRNRAGWLVLLALGLTAAACSKDMTGIGVGLPSNQANTGAYLLDTITVRASTVLRDSVVTSSSVYLMVGRTTDPLLGQLTAKSFLRLGIPGNNFKIDASYQYDSLVLQIATDAYRYGDTTKTQALVEVHKLITPISTTKPSYASPSITPTQVDPVVQNRGGVAPRRQARPNLGTLRLRLDDATLGRPLLTAGQSGLYPTQDLFDAYLPGLALTPATNDDAALLRLNATNASLVLYYHDPTNPGIALSFPFSANSLHFYQIEAVRNGGITNLPTASLQAAPSRVTGERTVVEGALGLETKLDFPYLRDLSTFGNNLTITSAQLTAYVPSATLSPYVPTPPALSITVANVRNQPIANYVASVPYQSAVSPITGLDQGSYTWAITSYVTAVLNRSIANNGLLVSSTNLDLPTRVVLGSSRSGTATDRLQLRLYLIQVQ